MNDTKALFNHNYDFPLASIDSNSLVLDIDEKGIRYTFEMPNTTYGNDLHGCVWVSVCQVLYNVNREQSELLLNEYVIKPERFQFLTIFQPKNLLV